MLQTLGSLVRYIEKKEAGLKASLVKIVSEVGYF